MKRLYIDEDGSTIEAKTEEDLVKVEVHYNVIRWRVSNLSNKAKIISRPYILLKEEIPKLESEIKAMINENEKLQININKLGIEAPQHISEKIENNNSKIEDYKRRIEENKEKLKETQNGHLDIYEEPDDGYY